MSKNGDFFTEKKSWSMLKDDLLANYLVPYLEKIKMTQKEILIVDCFAGKGRFDDGSLGSPLIIIDKVQASNAKHLTKLIFIEKVYGEELKKNIDGMYPRSEVWSGCYEDYIEKIRSEGKGKNVFLYIDPYGVKSLNFSFFSNLDNAGFNTIELLMNFNSNGFLREACCLLGCKCDDELPSISSEKQYEVASLSSWNSIANGDYWQGMLQNRQEDDFSLHPTEELLCKRYVKEMKTLFKYVVDVPIREKQKNMPHYRMIYATKHPSGVFLMATEMNKAWRKIIENSKQGQDELFQSHVIDAVNPYTQVRDFERLDLSEILLSKIGRNECNVRDLILDMIDVYGITYAPSDISNSLKELEVAEKIMVRRQHPFTPTNRPSKAWDFEKEVILVSSK